MKTRNAIGTILVVLLAFGFGIVFSGALTALAAPADDQPEILKIDVCHKDGESGNYSLVNVNINSTDDADGLNGHGDHEGDAWEPFTYGGVDYPGQGDMVNCSEPPDDDDDPKYVSEADCEGWRLVRVDLEEDETVAEGEWENPFEIESVYLQDFDVTIHEPENCLQVPPTETQEPPDDDDDDDKPDRLPNTGLSELPSTGSPLEWDGSMWQEPSSVNTWYAHNGVGGVAQAWLNYVPGTVFEFYGMQYVSTGWFKVAPESVWVIDGALDMNPYGLTLITCTGYNTQTKEWAYRLVVYAVPVQ